MKFGKEFRIHLEETLPDWRDKYLSYKPLKKLLKNIPAPAADNLPPDAHLPELHQWFVGILNEELEKFNDFYVDKEEDFIIRFQALKERIERVKARGNSGGVFTSETEFSDEIMEIRKDFVSIHGEMVLLKNYSSLNFAGAAWLKIRNDNGNGYERGVNHYENGGCIVAAWYKFYNGNYVFSGTSPLPGLIKILKKYDKRTGELLSLPFAQLAVHQPFFTTEPLTRLVHECEANLEVLFPLEEEVVESAPVDPMKVGTTQAGVSNALPETRMPLGEENEDIYRSTLAAIKAIQGFKKASSTYNPWSLSSLFGNQDNEITGAVTEENSPCDSLVSLPKGDDATDDVHSPK